MVIDIFSSQNKLSVIRIHIKSMFDNESFAQNCLKPLGLYIDKEPVLYFCTPINATNIISTNFDGLHFCNISKLSKNIIFLVNPMSYDGYNVRPVAHNFYDFIRLLVTLSSPHFFTAVFHIDKHQFELAIQSAHENMDSYCRDAVQKLSMKFPPMDDPYTYLQNINKNFNFSSIPYSDEYYEVTGITPPNNHSSDNQYTIFFTSKTTVRKQNNHSQDN